MDSLKAYWVKPEYEKIRIKTDVGEDLVFFPKTIKGFAPKTMLFSKMEIDKDCFVKVWWYNTYTSKDFKTKAGRDNYVYWIDPNYLVEVPIT